MNEKPLFELIENQERLEAFSRILRRKKIIAVDMEADSMYHFREKVCLIQIATRENNVLIDPFRIEDFSCLLPVFRRKDVRKIFHGADYDVRSLYRDFGMEIRHLFDTQIAARFTGLRESGLESVLHHHLGISLDKKYQRKDWSQRPLPPEMQEYAARDTHFLIPLERILRKKLKKLGRMDWVEEECDILSRVRSLGENPSPLFLKFKGAGQFRSRNLAVLEHILQARRIFAEKKDRPVFKIFGNNAVVQMVQERPVTLRQLEKTRALSRKQMKMYGEDIVAAVRRGLETPENELPVYPRKKIPSLSPKVPERIKKIKEWRDRRARELDIDPTLICNKALMTAIAAKNPRCAAHMEGIEDMRNWQIHAFGEEMIRVLHSKNSG